MGAGILVKSILTGNEDKPGGELLKDDDPLSLVDSGENDGDPSGGEG